MSNSFGEDVMTGNEGLGGCFGGIYLCVCCLLDGFGSGTGGQLLIRHEGAGCTSLQTTRLRGLDD